MRTRLFLVLLLSRCIFATVSPGMECNIEGLVMVWYWVYSESSYDIWNCKSRSIVKLVVLSYYSVACGSACCVTAFLVQLCNRVYWDGIQQVGTSYGAELGVSWV